MLPTARQPTRSDKAKTSATVSTGGPSRCDRLRRPLTRRPFTRNWRPREGRSRLETSDRTSVSAGREPALEGRRQRFMRRGCIWLAGLIPMLTLAACGSGSSTTLAVSHHGQTYRDSAGWVIEVPPGWHAVRFSDSKDVITSAGVQLSNVQLPPPTLVPGFPIQVNGSVLPARGVGL